MKDTTDPNASINTITEDTTIGQAVLTKREYFAGLAMSGYMAFEFAGHQDAANVAKYSVECADALINELNK